MWDYIYFYLYLEKIDISDHNALESYAHHKVRLSILFIANKNYIELNYLTITVKLLFPLSN